MMGQGKEIHDIPELFILTVAFISSCKLFRNKYVSLGGVGLIKTLKRLLAALELLSHDIWLKTRWQKRDVAKCWAPSPRTAKDSPYKGAEQPQFRWNQSDPQGVTTQEKSSCGSWRHPAGSGLKCHIRDVTTMANKSLSTHIYMSTRVRTHVYLLLCSSIFHCSGRETQPTLKDSRHKESLFPNYSNLLLIILFLL